MFLAVYYSIIDCFQPSEGQQGRSSDRLDMTWDFTELFHIVGSRFEIKA